MTKHWIVRWHHPDGRWLVTTLGAKPTEADARAQLRDDIGYFYDDIEIHLIEVTETVVETVWGSNKRGKIIR